MKEHRPRGHHVCDCFRIAETLQVPSKTFDLPGSAGAHVCGVAGRPEMPCNDLVQRGLDAQKSLNKFEKGAIVELTILNSVIQWIHNITFQTF